MEGTLRRLLRPRSAAIVGTSPSGGRGARVHRNLLDAGFRGNLWAINPKYSDVFGTPCVPTLADLPQVPDCVVLAVNAEATLELTAECARLGVGGIVALASGFAEAGARGQTRQVELGRRAAAGDVAMCGPNGIGLWSVGARFAAFSPPLPGQPAAGDVAIVSQSGGLLLEVLNPLLERGVAFSHMLSTGNEAATQLETFLGELVEQPEVRVLVAIVEAFRAPGLLRAVLARAAALAKPVVVLKVGRSPAGSRAAASHTGALAQDDEVVDAVLRTSGAIRVRTTEQLIETVVLFRDGRWPRPGGVALVSSSGGRCSLLGDLANGTALPLATFAPATLARLGELLPEFGTPNNPLDPTGVVFDRAGVFAPALEAIGNDPGVGLVGVFQVTRSINAPATAPAIAVERGTDQGSAGPRTHRSVGLAGEVVEAAQGSAAPVVAFTSATGGVVDPQVVEVLATGHVPLLRGLESALGAMGALVEAAAFRQQPVTEPAVLPAAARTAPARQALAVASGRLREAGALSEAETKALLQAYGVRTPGGHAVDTLDEALAAATEQGYPIVLKTSQPGLAHKSDHALVWLDVQTEAGVRAAFEALRPHGSGVLVEPQVPAGLELILGGRSTEFGPIVLCGAGGILAELVQDTALALAPLASRESAAALLDRTRVARLLDGFRGTPRDRTAVLDALLAVSWLVADLAATDLAFDLDVNPLVVDTRGAVVVDALLRAT